MYLLDTNVLSELRKLNADGNVVAWAKAVSAAELYISVITILEIKMGILRIENKDEAQGKVLRKWLEQHVLPSFRHRILPVDVTDAIQCAKLHVPNPSSERDALIAATALTHNMTVVTRNVRDFKSVNVGIINPWDNSTI